MRSMTIVEAEIFLLKVRYSEPFTTFHGTVTEHFNLIVKIKLEDGTKGIGEATPQKMLGETIEKAKAEAKQALEKLIGIDCMARSEWIEALPRLGSVSAAIDIAIHDAVSKAFNVPLYKLIGGSFDRVETDVTIGIPDKKMALRLAEEFIREGFRKLKVKIGISPLDDEIEKVNMIWEMLSEYESSAVRLDANEGYTIEKLEKLLGNVKAEIEFIEQPLPRDKLGEYPKLRKLIDIPILLDENIKTPRDAIEAWEMEACDYVNIKVSRVGGLYKAMKIAEVADELGLKCMIGCTGETCIGITASTCLAVSNKSIVFYDLDSDILTETFHRNTLKPPYRKPLKVPGHGINLSDLQGELIPIAKIQ